MKVYTTAPLEDPRDARTAFRILEEIGYDGAFSFEAKHDPFLPLVLALLRCHGFRVCLLRGLQKVLLDIGQRTGVACGPNFNEVRAVGKRCGAVGNDAACEPPFAGLTRVAGVGLAEPV